MNEKIKILSWNVNGIRAWWKKGAWFSVAKTNPDIICLQEIKVGNPQILSEDLYQPKGFYAFWRPASRPGYSGVVVFSKLKPLKVKKNHPGILGQEGRILELEYEKFILLNVYFPNGGASPERLKYKMEFYEKFLKYLKKLIKETKKEIIFTGDVNTAHQEIDLARPKENQKNSGFLPIERDWLDKLITNDFIDTFRLKHPKKIKYSWWDMKTRARERNVGWRIDYFFVSLGLKNKVLDSKILDDIRGSDHAPVILDLET